jgi:hypothetical protein
LLGLIKISEEIDLVCKSDPAVGEESDEWTPKNGHKGATVVTVRALNDRQLLRLSGVFVGLEDIDPDSPDPERTADFADAMERVVRLAFVRCTEGADVCFDASTVVEAMKVGPLVSLGSYVLTESGTGGDPT